MTLFSSDDEKRKKDRKTFLTVKNVLSLLNTIVKLYPVKTTSRTVAAITTVIDPTSVWFQGFVEILFEMIGNQSLSVKCSAALSLGVLMLKANTRTIIQNFCIRIRTLLMGNLVKKGIILLLFCK